MAYTYLSPARMKAQIRARKAGIAYKKKMAKRKWKTVTNIKVNMNTTAGMNLVSSAIKSGVMRTAKQKQASRKNLEKARAAKKRGDGIATKGYADVRSEIKRRKHWRKRSWM